MKKNANQNMFFPVFKSKTIVFIMWGRFFLVRFVHKIFSNNL